MKPHYKVLYACVRFYSRMRFHHNLSVEVLRARFRRVGHFPPATLKRRYPNVQCEAFAIDGVPAEWMDATPGTDKPIVLYLHGGGYFMGGIDTHRAFALRISYRCKVKVCSIDYRLAPEHPFPAALDDALKAYLWLKNAFPNAKIFIGGDSAGGGLTLATLLRLRDEARALPQGAFCFSPWTDLTGSGESLKSRKKRDCVLAADGVHVWREFYSGSAHWKEPYVSPLYGDYQNFPPLQIYVGEEELLLDDGVRVADKAKKAGVKVDLFRAPDMQHDWPLLFHALPEAKRVLVQLNDFFASA